MQKKKYNIGLILSDGSARGFAHTGALKTVEVFNISYYSTREKLKDP
ncbi:MAG: hypothetical protein ACOXZV_03615 [Bacteroidales bacterium]|jgi:predicted acylesterase/phospholipase RssA